MARSCNIPVIADADTGYGNELNVTRTVREYEMPAACAAIHIEDQVSPKRCGHLDGKEVVSREEFVSKIRAAVDGPQGPRFRRHRPHRRPRGARPGRGRLARQRRAGGRRRHGLRRGRADAGGGRRGAAAGEGPVPAERGARRHDAGVRPAAGRGDGLPARDPARACCSRRRSRPAMRHSPRSSATRVAAASSHAACAQTFRRFGADEWDALRARFAAGEPHRPLTHAAHPLRQALGRARGARPGRRLGAAAHRPPPAARPLGRRRPWRTWRRAACRCTTRELVFATPDHAVSSAPGRAGDHLRARRQAARRAASRAAGRPACASSTSASRARASST